MAEILMLHARPADAALVAPRLRAADHLELSSATGNHDKLGALRRCIEVSDVAWTVYMDGRAECIFGLRGVQVGSETVWVVWMLGSDAITRSAREFLRWSRAIWKILLARCGYLTGWVDDRYDAAKRWLEWLGCTLRDQEAWGPHGEHFRRFEASYV